MAHIHWIDSVDGSFSQGEDWSGGVVPGHADRAIINASGGDFTVSVTSNVKVESLDLSSNATLDIEDLTYPYVTLWARQGTGRGGNAGTIKVGDRAHLAVGGTVKNSGTIALDCDLSVRERRGSTSLIIKRDTTLTGGGSVILSDNPYNLIRGHGVTLTNVNDTISGSGSIGYDSYFDPRQGIKLVNESHGVIEATGRSGLSMVTDPRVSSMGSLSNDGRLEAIRGHLFIYDVIITGGGTILGGAGGNVEIAKCEIHGQTLGTSSHGVVDLSAHGDLAGIHLTSNGMISLNGVPLTVTGPVDNDGVVAVAGTITVEGAVTGVGKITVNGGDLTFTSQFDQDVTFLEPSGVLALAKSQSYRATISGFATSGATILDLGDISFVDAGEATFSGTASGGVLTVTDGTHTANINLTGNYLGATFVAASDGSNGVDVVAKDSQAPSAVHFVSAMAAINGHGGAAGLIEARVANDGRLMFLAAPRLAIA